MPSLPGPSGGPTPGSSGSGQDQNLSPALAFCKQVLKEVMGKSHAADAKAFYAPVDAEALGLRHYHKIIKRPMDLGTVKGKLDGRKYKTAGEFASDVRLIFQNCLTYHTHGYKIGGEDYPVSPCKAMKLKQLFEDKFKHCPGEEENRQRVEISGGSGSEQNHVPRHTDQDLERAVNEAIKKTEATLKRKIQDIYQCAICLSVTREGHIIQCSMGHLFCEGCLDDTNRASCPTCETPLNRNNKIRALGIEQTRDAVDLDFPCKHADCQVALPISQLKPHERKCVFRLVPCPMNDCNLEVSFQGLLRHIANDRCKIFGYSSISDSGIHNQKHCSHEHSYRSNQNLYWKNNGLKFQEHIFMTYFARVNGIFYSFMYLYGDSDEAKKYMVTMSIGHGTQTGIVHHGKIFPVDMKRSDILKESSGVLSFSSVGMSCLFFQDEKVSGIEKKVIAIRFKISKARSPNDPIPKVEHFQMSSLGSC